LCWTFILRRIVFRWAKKKGQLKIEWSESLKFFIASNIVWFSQFLFMQLWKLSSIFQYFWKYWKFRPFFWSVDRSLIRQDLKFKLKFNLETLKQKKIFLREKLSKCKSFLFCILGCTTAQVWRIYCISLDFSNIEILKSKIYIWEKFLSTIWLSNKYFLSAFP